MADLPNRAVPEVSSLPISPFPESKETTMQGLPHQYTAKASSSADSLVTAEIEGQPELNIAPPAAFGGPGSIHSPEDLQAAAVASCFILSFKAIAAASKLAWENLVVTVTGTLDQVERSVQFTGFQTRAHIELADGSSREKAEKLLEKAEQSCFITNSLKAQNKLSVTIEGGD
jgi:peroxiredoxin-like protein